MEGAHTHKPHTGENGYFVVFFQFGNSKKEREIKKPCFCREREYSNFENTLVCACELD